MKEYYKEIFKIIDDKIKKIKYSIKVGESLKQKNKNMFKDIESEELRTIEILEEIKEKILKQMKGGNNGKNKSEDKGGSK